MTSKLMVVLVGVVATLCQGQLWGNPNIFQQIHQHRQESQQNLGKSRQDNYLQIANNFWKQTNGNSQPAWGSTISPSSWGPTTSPSFFGGSITPSLSSGGSTTPLSALPKPTITLQTPTVPTPIQTLPASASAPIESIPLPIQVNQAKCMNDMIAAVRASVPGTVGETESESGRCKALLQQDQTVTISCGCVERLEFLWLSTQDVLVDINKGLDAGDMKAAMDKIKESRVTMKDTADFIRTHASELPQPQSTQMLECADNLDHIRFEGIAEGDVFQTNFQKCMSGQ